jgi:hypothetical protein
MRPDKVLRIADYGLQIEGAVYTDICGRLRFEASSHRLQSPVSNLLSIFYLQMLAFSRLAWL